MGEFSHKLICALRVLAVAALVVAAWNTTANAGFDEGTEAYQRGDYAVAERELRPLAEQGHAGAQNTLGAMYHNGQGMPKDYGKALEWYRKAADQGNVWAQVNLGIMYQHGTGVAADDAMAVHWFREAADRRHAPGQNAAAWLLATRATLRDSGAAVDYARRAVAANDIATYSDTLAAAYAAAGRFRDAVREERHAIAAARKAGNDTGFYEKRLVLYRRGEILTCPGGPCD